MKRLGNIYQQVISIDNLYAADAIAQRGKAKQPAVIKHMQNQDANIWQLHNALFDKNYRTSEYTTFKIHDPKEREVYRLPYFPDRIVHHAIMRVLEPMFKANFTADTYSCIKGKGVHAASFALRKALKNQTETLYCLKFDIKKFYPSVNHDVLKIQLRRKIKDTDLLWLLDEIIDSADGLPIGNYLSQYFANFYLSGFDHWIKETKRVKHYFRYADDVVILAPNKPYLHDLFSEITVYLSTNLKLAVKRNYQVFPVSARGIDFVGYKHYHTHTLLRKSIKKRFARMLKNRRNKQSIASYYGWAKHCNSTNLLNKLLNHDQKI
jgi:retron-type reverse transcriptase